ncbi:MAG: DUF433 domain-containing protein [Thermodesulfobacteriota bacterium]
MLTVTYPHIEVTPEGGLVLAGTPIKVIEIVLDHLAHRWDAEQIQRQHPHLSLGQIYSALAYYYDHQAEVDRIIEEQLRHVAAVKARMGPSPIRAKLGALGLLP